MISYDRIRSLPKAELHLHVEGTLEPELAFLLAARNNVAFPYSSIEELQKSYEFEDLQSFLNLYYECMTVLRTKRDFEDLAGAYLERAYRDGVRHIEMFFDPQVHVRNGVPIADVIEGLAAALELAAERYAITGGLIMCFLRDEPVESAAKALEQAAPLAGMLIGVGLDSAEAGNPPSQFSEVFARARALGLHLVAHAGEEGPAAYIAEALDLGVERIDHGIRALEDAAVVAKLRASNTPLTVCPLSNVKLRTVPSIEHHPLPALLLAGLNVSINSDDPAYFGGYVAANYAAVATAFELDEEALARLGANSIRGSFASEARKRELLDAIDGWRS